MTCQSQTLCLRQLLSPLSSRKRKFKSCLQQKLMAGYKLGDTVHILLAYVMLCLQKHGHAPSQHYIPQSQYCCSHLTSDAAVLLWYLFHPLRFLCFLAHPPTIFCWTRNVVLLWWHQFTWSIQGITIQKILFSYTLQITRFY